MTCDQPIGLTDDEIASITHGIHECAGTILDDIQIGMIDDLITEVRRLRAAITAVDKIHRLHQHNNICDSRPWAPCDYDDACEHDAEDWPCPTHTTLHPKETDHA